MPSATSKAPREAVDDLDNYGIDDDGADIFASPTPPGSASKKKADGGLGIDKEVDVKTRARAPAVKLDEERSVISPLHSAQWTYSNLCQATR